MPRDLIAIFCSRLPLDPAAGTVLALSGGPDSTALLDLFLAAGAPLDRLVAAHLDHGLRADSEADALFVGEQARAAGIAFVLHRADVAAAARRASRGLEETAREIRYDFLGRLAEERGFPFVATGHHRDDQAETVLLRILRGTGPRGLGAIRPLRDLPGHPGVHLVRPLLPFTRNEILGHLSKRKLPYRIDPTNLDGSNRRSLLRNRLLPLLARETPEIGRRLAALADRARELDPLRRPGLRESLLAALPPDAPMLDRRAVRRARRAVARGRGTVDLTGGWSLTVKDGALRVHPTVPPDLPACRLLLPCPGRVELPDGRVLSAAPTGACRFESDSRVEVVSPAAAPAPYEVRYARERDRFCPLGLGAFTTVLRFLKGQGVPREARRTVPVVRSRGRIVWVVGYRLDERARVGAEGGPAAILRITPPSSPPPRPRA